MSSYYGVQPREIFLTGRLEDAAIVERNSRTGEGFIVVNEAPCYMKCTEMSDWGKGIEVMEGFEIASDDLRIRLVGVRFALRGWRWRHE